MGNNKIVFGNTTLMDLTSDTVTPSKLAAGETAHDRSGEQITGTAVDLDGLSTSTTAITDNDIFATKENGGSNWVKKAMSKVAEYVKTKIGNQSAASGGTTLSLVTTGEKYNWNNKTDDTKANAALANEADSYSTSKAYAVGDTCIYNNVVYKCTTACSAASWAVNQNCFESTTLGKLFTQLNSDLNGFVKYAELTKTSSVAGIIELSSADNIEFEHILTAYVIGGDGSLYMARGRSNGFLLFAQNMERKTNTQVTFKVVYY